MPNFGIALGHNVDAEDVEDFVPYQPLTPGLQFTRRVVTANDLVDEGPYIRFTFGLLSETEYQAMLTQAGVYSAQKANVMIYAQDVNYVWKYWNGVAIKPLNEGRRGYFLNNVPLLIVDLYTAVLV